MKLKYSSFLLALAGLACIFVFLLLRLQFRQLSDHANSHPSLQISSNKPNIRTREHHEQPHETSDEHGSHIKPEEPSGTLKEVDTLAAAKDAATSTTIDQQNHLPDPDSPDFSNSVPEQQDHVPEHVEPEQHEPDVPPPLPAVPVDSLPSSPSLPQLPPPLESPQELVPNITEPIASVFPKIYTPISSSLSSSPLSHLFDLYTHHIKDSLVEAYSTAGHSIKPTNLVENFHHALRTGATLSDANTSPQTQHSSMYTYTYLAMANHIKTKLSELDAHLILEYSDLTMCSTLSHELLSSGGFNATLVLVNVDENSPTQTPNTNAQKTYSSLCAHKFDRANVLTSVVSTVSKPLTPMAHDCIQYIQAYTALDIQTLLPFEYEVILGGLLEGCTLTYLPISLPSSPYFLYWESVEELVGKAAGGGEGPHTYTYTYSISEVSGFVEVRRARKNDSSASVSSSSSRRGSSWNSAASNGYGLGGVQSSMGSVSRTGTSDCNPKYLTWREIKELPLHPLSRLKASMLLTQHSMRYGKGYGEGEVWWLGDKFSSNYPHTACVPIVSAAPSPPPTSARYGGGYMSSMYGGYTSSASYPTPTLTPSPPPTESAGLPIALNTTGSTDVDNSTKPSLLYPAAGRRRLFTSYTNSHSNTHVVSRRDVYGEGVKTTSAINKRLYARIGGDRDDIFRQFEVASRKFREVAGVGKGKDKSGSTAKSDYYISSNTRKLHKKLYTHERHQYHYWVNTLPTHHLHNLTHQSGRVYVMGGAPSLLSIKLARLLKAHSQDSMVVTIHLTNETTRWHHQLAMMMGVERNLICLPGRHVGSIMALGDGYGEGRSSGNGQDSVSIIQADTFPYLLSITRCDGLGFVQLVASLFKMPNTLYVQFMSQRIWREVVDVILKDGGIGHGDECAELYTMFDDIDVFIQRIVNELHEDLQISEVLGDSVYILQRTSGHTSATGDSSDAAESTSSSGVSVSSLIHLGVIPEQKKTLLKLLVSMPIWSYNAQGNGNNNGLGDIIDSALHIRDVMLKVDKQGKWYVDMRSNTHHRTASSTSSKAQDNSLLEAYVLSKTLFNTIHNEFTTHSVEMADGKFSMVQHDSQYGMLSTLLATKYPLSTMVSIAYSDDDGQATMHQDVLNALNLSNNAICVPKLTPEEMYQHFYHSPELFRFQLLSLSLLDEFCAVSSLSDWGERMQHILSSALTSFVYVPNLYLVSWAMYVLFNEYYLPSGQLIKLLSPISSELLGHHDSALFDDPLFMNNVTQLTNLFSITYHPQHVYTDFISQWLMHKARTDDGTVSSFLISPLYRSPHDLPVVRLDVVNLTRHVKHHFQSDLDGHKRTYTMHISVNLTETQRVQAIIGDASQSKYALVDNHIILNDAVTLPLGHHVNHHDVTYVHLYRDKDDWPIPYSTIYGITLITALRLGLIDSQRDKLFKEFLKMPLYEDMAPWNIVLMGPSVDYIDYDTKDITFDADVPKAYRVMSVLMNYKRTVQDFKRCGSNSPTVYGLPFISDCVGSSVSAYNGQKFHCDDLRYPVPCGDGVCHSDYISCLRALSSMAESLVSRAEDAGKTTALLSVEERLAQTLAQAMASVVSSFNQSTSSRTTYQEFLKVLAKNN